MDHTPPTEKLYLEDPYTVSFQADVLSCDTLDDDRVAVVLDGTCFYPTSGGQLADRGKIAGVDVDDVWEDEAGVVYHALSRRLPPGAVDCRVDWTRRFDHMQQHTGQHALSRAFVRVAALDTVSFHMGADTCTIDLAGKDLTDEIMLEAESLANSVVWENRPVVVRDVAPDALDDLDLRKKIPDGVGSVRLVEIEGFDVIGCCGTHVRSTGELGMIKLLKFEKAKRAYRVYFKVGGRARRDYHDKHEIVRRLSNRFTTSLDGIEDKVAKLQAEGQRNRKEVHRLAKKLAGLEVDTLIETAEKCGECRFLARVLEGYDEIYLRALASELKRSERMISVIGTQSGLVICNASKDVDIDLAAPAVEMATSLGGSGGGKGGFATVQLPAEVSVGDFVDNLAGRIKQTL